MRAINHSLTGAVIGLTVADPLIAAPLALASHYVMDSIPHFGNKSDKNNIKTRLFNILLIADAILCTILVVIIVIIRPIRWLPAIICAFLAAAPDFLSINRFYASIAKKPWKPNLYSKFASKIQWFEKPIGVVVETVWLVAALFCLSIFLRH